MNKFNFIVTVKAADNNLTQAELAAHIKTAVKSWGGGGHPDSPVWPSRLHVEVVYDEKKKN